MSLLSACPEPTQAEAVYGRLKSALMTGLHRPGQKLSIRRLAEDLGTGTSPVREALKRLASERVLDGSAKRSYAVPVLGAKRTADLFNLRALLECEAAVRAVERIDAATIDAIARTVGRMEEAVAEGRPGAYAPDAYMVENHRFHFLIYRGSGNPDMIAVIEQLWMQTAPSLRAVLDAATPDAGWREVHDAVVDALRARSAEATRAALLRDIRWDWLGEGTPLNGGDEGRGT